MLMNRREQGLASGLFLVVMTLGFILSTAFAIWAFIGMQENQADLDKKIANATSVAVQQAETAKEAEFVERENKPFRSYSGTPTYGSLTFSFPKTWNVYAVNKDSGTLLDFYANPNLIPGLGRNVNFAFRVQILDTPYETEAGKLDGSVKSGKITADPYRAPLVQSELGIYLRGEIVSGKQGVMVLLPQRDKTFKLWTETEEYIDEFDEIMETLTFIP